MKISWRRSSTPLANGDNEVKNRDKKKSMLGSNMLFFLLLRNCLLCLYILLVDLTGVHIRPIGIRKSPAACFAMKTFLLFFCGDRGSAFQTEDLIHRFA
jgi:hypothetical protein